MANTHTVEILVRASSNKEAFTLVSTCVGDWSAGGTITEHGSGYYIASDIIGDKELTDEFYQKLKDADNLALLTDELATERRTKILDDASLVENCLRKLLLHISGAVEGYYELFAKREYAKKHASKKATIMAKESDPITSHLQFGDMIELLNSDLNVSKRELKNMQDWLQLLEGLSTLDELRDEINDRLKVRQVWEVISESLLVQPCPWGELKKQLDDMKSLRNRAGHFQALAPKDVKSANMLRETILHKIGAENQKPDNQVDYAKLAGLDKWIGERMSRSVLDTFLQAQAVVLAQQLELARTVLQPAPLI